MKTESFLDIIQTYIPELESLLNAGVEEVKLVELESRLGCVFPEDFRSLWVNKARRLLDGVLWG